MPRSTEPEIEDDPLTSAPKAPIASKAGGRRKPGAAKGNGCATDANLKGSVHPSGAPVLIANGTSPAVELCAVDRMTLRQKLGEVRRRIAYIQKRGYNERHDYNYMAAADIAGTVGDILAELGVVVIPRLESITFEPQAPGRLDSVRVVRVIMPYTFTDVNSAEENTAKVAGERLDVGDKASYKAITGALKCALLQSFLLATGDDPEDQRADLRTAFRSETLVSAEQVWQLQGLIEGTGTDLERVLAITRSQRRANDRSFLSARTTTANWTNRTAGIEPMSRIELLHQNTPQWHRWVARDLAGVVPASWARHHSRLQKHSGGKTPGLSSPTSNFAHNHTNALAHSLFLLPLPIIRGVRDGLRAPKRSMQVSAGHRSLQAIYSKIHSFRIV
jgi:hypothetical protein